MGRPDKDALERLDPDKLFRPDGAKLKRVDRYEWTEVLKRLRTTSTVKLVAIFMASWGDKSGKDNFPGVILLSNTTEEDDRTVKVALKKLRDFGMVYRIFEGSLSGRAGGYADHHILTVPEDLSLLPLLPEDMSHPERDAKREAKREADRKRKAAKASGGGSAGGSAGASPKGSAKGSPKGDGCRHPDGPQGDDNRHPEDPPNKEEVISDPEEVILKAGRGDPESRIPVSQITPPNHVPTYRPTYKEHPSAQILERPHAAARGDDSRADESFRSFEAQQRKLRVAEGEKLSDEDEEELRYEIGYAFVEHVVGDLTGAERSVVEGMLSKVRPRHPKQVVASLFKARGAVEHDYINAQKYLLLLPDPQVYIDAAHRQIEAHVPGATHRYVYILAMRLAQRDQVRAKRSA